MRPRYTRKSHYLRLPLWGKINFTSQIRSQQIGFMIYRAELACFAGCPPAVALLTEMGRSATPAPLCGTRACLCPGLLRCDDCQLSIISIYNVITHFNLDVYITSNERDSSPLRRWGSDDRQTVRPTNKYRDYARSSDDDDDVVLS